MAKKPKKARAQRRAPSHHGGPEGRSGSTAEEETLIAGSALHHCRILTGDGGHAPSFDLLVAYDGPFPPTVLADPRHRDFPPFDRHFGLHCSKPGTRNRTDV